MKTSSEVRILCIFCELYVTNDDLKKNKILLNITLFGFITILHSKREKIDSLPRDSVIKLIN